MLSASNRASEVLYIGEKGGMEEKICQRYGIPFSGIRAGKWRRYFSFRNLIDAFAVPVGYFEALGLLRSFRPDIVFSKGGYVSIPVVFAARTLKIKVVIHESDSIPGLASRLCARSASKICVSWEETMRFFPKEKTVFTGIPLRSCIFEGNRDKGLSLCGFSEKISIVFVVGGSTGARSLNELVWKALPDLLPHCQVVHFVGKGKGSSDIEIGTNFARYKQFEYLEKEYADVLACSDIVVSRAGANALHEFIALKKPSILIPLGLCASRGDQIANAAIMKEKGASTVLDEHELSAAALARDILSLCRNNNTRASMRKAAASFHKDLLNRNILEIISEVLSER